MAMVGGVSMNPFKTLHITINSTIPNNSVSSVTTQLAAAVHSIGVWVGCRKRGETLVSPGFSAWQNGKTWPALPRLTPTMAEGAPHRPTIVMTLQPDLKSQPAHFREV
jgi:hypothetical protein